MVLKTLYLVFDEVWSSSTIERCQIEYYWLDNPYRLKKYNKLAYKWDYRMINDG